MLDLEELQKKEGIHRLQGSQALGHGTNWNTRSPRQSCTLYQSQQRLTPGTSFFQTLNGSRLGQLVKMGFKCRRQAWDGAPENAGAHVEYILSWQVLSFNTCPRHRARLLAASRMLRNMTCRGRCWRCCHNFISVPESKATCNPWVYAACGPGTLVLNPCGKWHFGRSYGPRLH